LLTWASLNLIGGGQGSSRGSEAIQEKAFKAADKQICEWGIEHNGRARVQTLTSIASKSSQKAVTTTFHLAPSWVIAEKFKNRCKSGRVEGSDRLQANVQSRRQLSSSSTKTRKGATISDGRVVDPFDPSRSWSLNRFEVLRACDAGAKRTYSTAQAMFFKSASIACAGSINAANVVMRSR
jgi:putative DNA methylase